MELSTQIIIFSLFFIAIAFFVILFFALRLIVTDKLIFEKKNKYHHIMVYEDGSVRTLRLGKGIEAGKQSKIDTADPGTLLLEYTRLVFAGLLVKDNPRKILIIGLGGGVIPRALDKCIPGAEIHVVDIDPDVIKVAKEYFLFKPEKNIRLHISDGRFFIQKEAEKKSEEKFDMIILDAFNSSSIPGHLLTKEFLEQVREILDRKGVIVANILSDNSLFNSILKTYRKVFGTYHVFMGEQARNAVLIIPGFDASGLDSKNIMFDAEKLQNRYHFNFSMVAVARHFRPHYQPKGPSRILTD